MKPKVTVFTSCYNQCVFLEEAIESVLNQSFDNFEYLLFNDGSTDSTPDIMDEYAKRDSRIKVFHLEKQPTLSHVINKSIIKSTGKYWTWCPSDDKFHPDLLKQKLEFSNSRPLSVIYDNWWLINDQSESYDTRIVKPMTPKEFSEEVWRSSPIGFTGILIPTMVLYYTQLFPMHLKFSEDFYWMIKATIMGISFEGMPEKLHYKRKHNNTSTSKNSELIIDQIPVIRHQLKQFKDEFYKRKA